MGASPRRLIAGLVAGWLLLLGAGVWYFVTQRRALKQEAEANLEAIAVLKADQITAWRAERLGDAVLLATNAFFGQAATRWLADGQTGDTELILRQFRALQEHYGYRDVMLVDAAGQVRLSLRRATGSLDPAAGEPLTLALRERRPRLTDLHTDSDGVIHLGTIAPLVVGEGTETPVAGALILRSDARDLLYPLIQSWPTPSRTAETLLVRRDGDDVLFLSDLRHQSGAALSLRIPVRRTTLPAARAALGQEGAFTGIDYRGVEVLSVTRAIPDSPWAMVAKVDASEAFAAWRFRAMFILALFVVFTAAAVAVSIAAWQAQQKEHYQALHEAEQALRESEERHRVTLLSVGDGVIATDAEGRVTLVNPVAEALTGWPQAEARGRPLEEVFRIINEETREPVANPARRVLEEGLVVGLANHTVLIARDGTERPIADSGAPIRYGDNVLGGVVLVFRDQTEERAAQRHILHLNRVLEALGDINRTIVRATEPRGLVHEACEILRARGYGWAAIVLTDCVDRGGEPALHVQAGMEAEESLAAGLDQGTLPPCCEEARSTDGVYRMAGRDDRCGPCPVLAECGSTDTLCACLRHGEETHGYMLVSMRGHTGADPEEAARFGIMASDLALALHDLEVSRARDRAEAEKEKLQAQLLQAQKMEAVGRLAGGVAHDFNNMLQAILGYSDLLLEQVGAESPLRDDLLSIRGAAERSARLTGQLLAFARKQTISPEVLDLNETVGGVLKMLGRLIGEDIDLVWAPGHELWHVRMDPSQVDQILANLAVNARDAIAGVGKLTIETANAVFDEAYCADHAGFVPGEYAMLAVSDDGCGMDQATLEHVFEPFFTTKGEGEGTGLGLATVYGVVKQNGGFINAYSESGKGSTFRIYLPRFQVQDTETADRRPTAVAPSGTETVLLVEDEPVILDLGTRFLERLGYTVLTAGTPSEALRLAAEYPGQIHLLMTDVVMPEMSGRDLAQELLAVIPGLKGLYMSGYAANVIAHRGVLEEGVHFLQKPFTPLDLAVRVRETLDD